VLQSGTEAERYDAVITLANHVKKGWFATLLASTVDTATLIPKYIIEAVAFASRDVINEQVIWKIVQYSFSGYDEDENSSLVIQMKEASSKSKRDAFIKTFRETFPDDMATVFLDEVERR
jgi:hypothetical protein